MPTAGKLSLVFDAIFHSSLKTRTLTDPEFKTFLIGMYGPYNSKVTPVWLTPEIELAFQRIEAQTSGSILLSRQIGTPNIPSKGKLEPRTVQIPRVLYPEGHPSRVLGLDGDGDQGKGKKLIEEVGEAKRKDVLKTPTGSTPEIPSWTWTKTSTKIKITINVPKLVCPSPSLFFLPSANPFRTQTHAQIPSSTLDLEPRRIILSIPSLYTLDVNLDASDAEIAATFSSDGEGKGMESALTLKRLRDLDVGEARAEWRVGEGVVVVYA